MTNNPIFKCTVGQHQELLRILGDLGFGPTVVKKIITSRDPKLALAEIVAHQVDGWLVMSEAWRFLPSIFQQACTLKKYLTSVWLQYGLSNSQMIMLDKSLNRVIDEIRVSGGRQRLTDCTVVFLWLGSLSRTFKFYWNLTESLLNRDIDGIYVNQDLSDEAIPMELVVPAYPYSDEPCVYFVRGLNLIANYNVVDGCTAAHARSGIEESGKYSSSLEALALYAMSSWQSHKECGGNILPYLNLVGIRCGDRGQTTPVLLWDLDDGHLTINFSSGLSSTPYFGVAAPSFKSATPI